MNQRILALADELFRDIEMNEESSVLKEELCADLDERFSDLIREGLDEEAAIQRIRADLSDFDQLTKTFPHRRQALPALTQDMTDTGKFSEIVVRLKWDDLDVLPSPDDRLSLRLSGDGEAQWRSEIHGGCLSLTIERPEDTLPEAVDWVGRVLKMLYRHIRVAAGCRGTLLIPASWRGKLRIETASGDARVEVPVQRLEINTASGDIQAMAEAGSLSVNTASGDVEARGAFSELRAVTVSGDMTVDQYAGTNAELKTTSGDITYHGETARLAYKTVSGDVNVAITGRIQAVNGSAVSGDTHIRLADSQPAHIKAHTVSGSQRFRSAEGPEAAEMTLSSVSGDIIVE